MQDPKLVAYYRVSTKRQARQWTRLGGPEHRRGDLRPGDRGQDHQELHRGRENRRQDREPS